MSCLNAPRVPSTSNGRTARSGGMIRPTRNFWFTLMNADLPDDFIYAVRTDAAFLYVYAGSEKYTVMVEPHKTPGHMMVGAVYSFDRDGNDFMWYWPNNRAPDVKMARQNKLFGDCMQVAEDHRKVREVMHT